MSKKGKIRTALGSLLALTLVITCVAVYQTGSKSTPNEKEFVKENEEDSVDEAIRTEEREEEEETEDANASEVDGEREIAEEESAADVAEAEEDIAAFPETTEAETEAADSTAVDSQPMSAPDMNFTESSLMEWPVNGQVVLDYNMDNTVYFPTLNVYKLNPAVAISSEVGTPVAAVANGQIVSITENEETGTTLTIDMGNGYQAVYGQLKDVPFSGQEYVSAGSVLGYVSEPTKYYAEEGANLYFALKKDDTPLDPMQYLP